MKANGNAGKYDGVIKVIVPELSYDLTLGLEVLKLFGM